MSKTLALSVVVGATIGQSYFRALESAQQRSERLGKTWTSTNAKLGATRNVLKYQTLLGQLRDKQAALGRSSTRLDRGIAEVERRYREARRAARGYGIELGDVVREHDRLGRALARTESQQRAGEGKQGAGARFGALRTRLLGLAGAAYGAGRMVGAAMDRAEQGRYLGTVINPADGDRDAGVARARARTHARAFARDSLATEQEVLEIEYALSSAGLGETVARAGTEFVHKLAKVTRGAPEQVGEIVGVTFNTMAGGLEGTAEEKMQRIGDVLAKTQFKFQIRDFGQLGESLKYASAHAVSAKVSLEQTAATIGVLNTAGLQGSMAGTAFGAVLRNLTKASDELGFEVVRDDAGALDLIATLGSVKEALADYDIDERNDLLQELFGDEGKRGAVPLLDMLDQLKTGVAEVSAAAGSGLVDAEYLRFLDSASGQWTMLKQNVAQVGAVFGGVLLPAVNAVVAPMARVAGWVASGIERYQVLGQALGAVGGAIAAVGFVLTGATALMWAWHTVAGIWAGSALIGGVGRLSRGLMGLAMRAIPLAIGRLRTFNATALITAARNRALAGGGASRGFGTALMRLATRAIPVALGALRALTVAVMANPLGLIVGGIALGASLIIAYWAPIKTFFVDLWGGMKRVWEGVSSWLATFSLGAAAGKVVATLGDALGSFSPLDAIRSAWHAVTDWLTTFSLGAAAGKVVATLGDALGSFSPLDAIRSAWRAVTDWLTTFSLAESAGKVVATLGDALGSFSPLDAIRSAWRAVTDWLTTFSLAESAGKVVATLGDALGSFSPLDAIRSAWRAAADWLTTFSLAESAGKVIATLGDALGSFSPLDAIRSAWHAAADWLTTFSLAEAAGKVVATLGDALGSFSPLDAIRSAWHAVTDWLTTFSLAEAAGKVVATLGDALGSFSPLDAIRSAWRAVTDWLTTFSLAETVGKVAATLGDALGGFSPLDAIRSAWRAVTDWLTTFSLAEAAGKVVATLGDALGSFSPLDAIRSAWRAVTDWLTTFSLAESAGKVVATLGDALGSFSPLDAIRSAWRAAADWLTTFSLAESAGKVVATLGDALGGFSPLDAIRSAWRAVTDWLATFSLAESAGKVVATLGDALGSFSPLDAIRSAWRAVTDWLTTFSLAESAGKVVATLGDALGSFSPLDAIRSAWRAAADWLTTFSLAESAGKVVATLGDALRGFSPLDAIKTAWKEVTDWLDKLSLAETAGKAIDTLGTAANTAWQGVTHLFGGDDDTEPAPVVTAIHTAQQAIVGRLGAVVRSVDALGAAPRPVLAGALAGAAIGAAAAAPVAPAQPLPLPVASAPAPQARAAPRTITVNIQPGAVAITLAAAPDTDLDTLAEALQHRMADLLRQATTEAMDAEADEVA